MTAYNAKFWQRQFRDDFIPATHRVVEVFLSRLLPTFSTAESEAEAYTEKLWEDAMSQPCAPDGPDHSEIAEMVREAGIDHYLGLKGMEQGVLNCCALFMYHLFEQHLMLFHRKELLDFFEQDEIKLISHAEFHKRMKAVGIDVKSFSAWKKIAELELLANALKHGEGRSSRELAIISPDLFTDHTLETNVFLEGITPGRIYTPLMGEDLYVTTQKVREYSSAIEGFWNELSGSFNGI